MNQFEQLRFLILAAQREGNTALARALEDYGLTPSQAEVIRIVGDHGELTVGGIGELLICESGTNPSRLVNRLALLGFLNKTPRQDDKRHIVVTLTTVGRAANSVIKQTEAVFYSELENRCRSVDVQSTIELLTKITEDTPAGAAFIKRNV